MGILVWHIGDFCHHSGYQLVPSQQIRRGQSQMNITVFGLNLAISLTIAWFIARPSNWEQRATAWLIYFIVSLGVGIVSEGVEVWRVVVISTLSLSGMATYSAFNLWYIERIGRRWNESETIYWWRPDATSDNGNYIGVKSISRFSRADATRATQKSRRNTEANGHD